jgi:aspartyl-tRNA(Asn)/glutamyl-tRNA(Gln) amidotransferase subunit A
MTLPAISRLYACTAKAMAAEDLLTAPLRVTAERLRNGALSSSALVEALLDRIRVTEPLVRAYTTVGEDEMRLQAAAADADLQSGRVRGPLHGLPIAIKDLIDTAGLRTTYGSSIYGDHVPERDATVVTRLRDAGAVIAGKTNTHEFALGCVTPPTRNPFDLEHIPGGSSGGSAAAVSARSALAALGSDSGGSIRTPASLCGVFGLKPTYGRVSRSGVFTESWSVDHIGPITRRVEDAALLIDVIAGYDETDPTSDRIDRPSVLPALDRGVDGIKLAVPENYFYDAVDPAVESAVRKATDHLETLGAAVRPMVFPLIAEITAAHTAIDLAEIAANHRQLYAQHAREYQDSSRHFVELGFFVSATSYIDALRSRARLLNAVLTAMGDADLIVVPAQPITAPCHDEDVVLIDGAGEEDALSAMTRLVLPFNLLGLPAASICCGYDGKGLPIGLQLVGKPFAEATVLQVAHAYQSTTPWLERLIGEPLPAGS